MSENEARQEHTPGPWVRWEFDEPSHELIEYEGNIELGQESGFRIATVWQTPREDAEANARLIASAPDLLAALERMTNVRRDWIGPASYRDSALAAIDKAKGQAVAS